LYRKLIAFSVFKDKDGLSDCLDFLLAVAGDFDWAFFVITFTGFTRLHITDEKWGAFFLLKMDPIAVRVNARSRFSNDKPG